MAKPDFAPAIVMTIQQVGLFGEIVQEGRRTFAADVDASEVGAVAMRLAIAVAPPRQGATK